MRRSLFNIDNVAATLLEPQALVRWFRFRKQLAQSKTSGFKPAIFEAVRMMPRRSPVSVALVDRLVEGEVRG